MLNKEYYKDLLVEFVVNDEKLALMDGVPCKCDETPCAKCEFDNVNVDCAGMRKRWANMEYTEPRIHWEDVPVDTPVYLNYDSRKDIPAHFSSYDAELDKITVFDGGRTSFTVEYSHVCGAGTIPETTQYLARQVTLAKEEDMKKYYRR